MSGACAKPKVSKSVVKKWRKMWKPNVVGKKLISVWAVDIEFWPKVLPKRKTADSILLCWWPWTIGQKMGDWNPTHILSIFCCRATLAKNIKTKNNQFFSPLTSTSILPPFCPRKVFNDDPSVLLIWAAISRITKFLLVEFLTGGRQAPLGEGECKVRRLRQRELHEFVVETFFHEKVDQSPEQIFWNFTAATMLDIFIRLKTLVKISHIHIDSSVFRLHWCISSVILLTFSVIVTTRQYVGNPIDCIHTNDVPDDVFDLYCWIHSTYTIPRALSLHVGEEVAHPGVLKSSADEEEERRYVSYYQWVGFTLFFQVSRQPLLMEPVNAKAVHILCTKIPVPTRARS